MSVNKSVATWVLAKLYVEDVAILRKPLLKGLCQASFDTINESSEFSDTLKHLVEKDLIEEEYGGGYVIAEDGIIEIRKEIGRPFGKVLEHIELLPEIKDAKFSRMVDAIRDSKDITLTAAKLCVDNTPLVFEFLNFVHKELLIHGISIL